MMQKYHSLSLHYLSYKILLTLFDIDMGIKGTESAHRYAWAKLVETKLTIKSSHRWAKLDL